MYKNKSSRKTDSLLEKRISRESVFREDLFLYTCRVEAVEDVRAPDQQLGLAAELRGHELLAHALEGVGQVDAVRAHAEHHLKLKGVRSTLDQPLFNWIPFAIALNFCFESQFGQHENHQNSILLA